MERPDMGAVYLIGPDHDVWMSKQDEVIAIKSNPCNDMLSAWLSGPAADAYHRLVGRHRAVRDFPELTGLE
jgi:hypothetical protein